MSEELFIEQLDEAISAIVAGGEATAVSDSPGDLAALAAIASELRLFPRQQFKTNLKEALIRSAAMTTSATETEATSKSDPAPSQTITPYLTVKRPGHLIDWCL